MSSQISCNEMVRVFNEFYVQGKYINVIFYHDFGKVMIGTEELELCDNDDNIVFEDINDAYLSIDKSHIRMITLSEDCINDVVTIDTGDSKIVFLVNK